MTQLDWTVWVVAVALLVLAFRGLVTAIASNRYRK